jgi:hypothetical protein
MADFDIVEWETIKDDYSDCLLLGNGASIAVDEGFSYSSLLEEARSMGLISERIEHLFDHFETQDFENILRLVWHTFSINRLLDIDEKVTPEVYDQIRGALIQIVNKIHVNYHQIEGCFPKISEFIKEFHTILSLNYDLILYWGFLWSNDNDEKVKFKDCFVGNEFDSEWEKYYESIRPSTKSVLVFYPHGNLVLAHDLLGNERKIVRRNIDEYLVDRITNEWNSGNLNPIFVSEGKSDQKLNAILRSGYLSTVYNSIIPSIQNSMVVYGWSMSKNDDHILRALMRSNVRHIAVSVYLAGEDVDGFCYRIDRKIRESSGKRGKEIKIDFFDSASKGCWVN